MTDGTMPETRTDLNDEVSGYFQTRLAPNPHRTAVWQHICRYMETLDSHRFRGAGTRRRLV